MSLSKHIEFHKSEIAKEEAALRQLTEQIAAAQQQQRDLANQIQFRRGALAGLEKAQSEPDGPPETKEGVQPTSTEPGAAQTTEKA